MTKQKQTYEAPVVGLVELNLNEGFLAASTEKGRIINDDWDELI